jgi:sulfite exporter TauE/SafE
VKAAFLLGLLGSWHCAGMCGAFTWARGRRYYLIGRLLGYLAVGAFLGGLGYWALAWVSSPLWLGVLGSLSVAAGWANWQSRPAPVKFSLLGFVWTHLGPFLKSPGPRTRFLTGLFTAALPCGLLSAAYLLALAEASPFQSALTMSAFWLGSLPGLLLPPVLLGKFSWGVRLQPIAMIASGVVMLLLALWPAANTPGGCH